MTEMTDANLFKLFVGKQSIDTLRWSGEDIIFFVRRLDLDTEKMEDYRCCIKQNDFKEIKDVFTGSLQSLSTAEHLLLLLWIREVKFMMDSLQDTDRLGFVQNAFALNNIEIDVETVKWEFQKLLHKGYISEGITGDDEIKDYFLTARGTITAEELFDKMKMLISARSETENAADSLPTPALTKNPAKQSDAKDRARRIRNAAYEYYRKLLKGEDVTKEGIAANHGFEKETNVLSKDHIQKKYGLDTIEKAIDEAVRLFESIQKINDKEKARLRNSIYNTLKR